MDAAYQGREAHLQLWRDILKYIPSVILPRLTGIITVPIITRLFSPEVFGTYALVMANVTVLNSAALSGIGSSLLRFLPERVQDPEREGELLSTIFTMALGLCAAISIAGVLGLRLFSAHTGDRFLSLMTIGFLLFTTNGIFLLVSHVLRSAGKAGMYSTIQLVSGYGGLAFGLLLVLVFRSGIGGLLLGNILAGLLGITLAWPAAMRGRRVRIGALSRPVLNDILWFALFISMGNASYWLLSSSDRWLLRIFQGMESVGLYAASYDLSSKTIQMGVIAFGLALQPLSVTTWEERGRATTELLLANATRTYVLFMLPAVVGLSLLARPLIAVLATARYVGGARIIPFVASSIFLFGLLDIAGRALTLSKRPDIEARNFLIAGVTNVGLNLLLIPHFGIVAAALSALCGYAVLLGLHAASVRGYVCWRFPWKSAIRAALACGVMSAVVLVLQRLLGHLPGLLRLLALIVAGAATYGATILLMGEVSILSLRRLFSRENGGGHASRA